jgi:hypothetical protein
MACINPDGSLSAVARSVLLALQEPRDAVALGATLGLPAYRLRATLREIGEAGLIAPANAPTGDYVITALGQEALKLDAEAHALGH